MRIHATKNAKLPCAQLPELGPGSAGISLRRRNKARDGWVTECVTAGEPRLTTSVERTTTEVATRRRSVSGSAAHARRLAVRLN